MALPDVIVTVTSAAAPATEPSDTGQAFFVGVTQRGRTDQSMALSSLQDFLTYCGQRLVSSVLYDAVETFFSEGGRVLYVSRVFGAGAATATLNLLDSGAAIALVVKAGQGGQQDPGTWANGAAGGLSVAVVSLSSGYQIQVLLNGVQVEASWPLVTQQDAINWSQQSKYVTIALGAGTIAPAVAGAANLAGGTDGSSTVDADWQAALDRISSVLGPGQICAPGRTTSAGQLQLLDHAQKANRFALLDGQDTATDSTLSSQAASLYAAPNNGRRYGQLCAPWDVIPGLTVGTTRTVPPCARLAAQYAVVDALGNPNQAAAGKNGKAKFVQDLSQPKWTDTQRLSLNNAGVTVSRRRFAGSIMTYGFRTLADQQQDAQWSMAPNVRCVMAYVAQAKVVGDNHEFDQVDGGGRELASFKGDLTGPALQLFGVGALFGATPAEAFLIDTGPGLNPPTNLAAGIMTAAVKLRTSPGAEQVQIQIIKTPITQSV
jgi:hypothetical protein